MNCLSPDLSGLEVGDALTANGARQITLDAQASAPGGCVRMLTQFSPGAVSEPASLAPVRLAVLELGLGAAKRGRRQA